MNPSGNKNNNKSYYVNFTTQMFLGAKELLKSMPTFYNRVYFSSKYANALWSGEKEEVFTNVTLLTEENNIEQLRQIIKNNFLYIGDWDSQKFTDKADYGFSFIGGNIKYILMPFKEIEDGYRVRSYDVDTGDCYETHFSCDKKYFLDSSIKDNGEFVRTADFNLEYITDANTVKERAPRKSQPQMVTYDNRGYTATNMYLLLLIAILSVATVITTVLVAKGIIG